jgi:[ribosomal protein S5]-alanine N-acetyltransferase
MNELPKLKMPEKIVTVNLLITRLRLEDAEEMYYAYASKDVATKYVSWPTHPNIASTRKYLKSTIKAWNEGIEYSYAIRLKQDNRLIGSIGVINESGKCSFGYILSPNHWGKGYATEAAKSILNLLIQQENVFRIWTLCHVDNQSSARVLQKVGMVLESKLEKWLRFPNLGNEPGDCNLFKYQL